MVDKGYSVFEEWASYIIKILKTEFDYSSMIKHPTEVGNARESLIKGVLKRIVPNTYEIGTGIIIDNKRNSSKQIDIVISRGDFPSI